MTTDMAMINDEDIPIVCNNAVNFLEKSINDRANGIFVYIKQYLADAKTGEASNAVLTGSSVTNALVKSISPIYGDPTIPPAAGDDPLYRGGWDFNDIDIVTNNELGVVVLFQTLYKWANRGADTYENQLKKFYNPPQITYTKSPSYPSGTLGPNMNIRSTHNFKIGELDINLIVISGSLYNFIKSFDLTINQVYYDGSKINIGPGNPAMIYKHLVTREFPALYRTYNRSTWAVTLERIEKYRERGFTIRLSQSIIVDNPSDNGVLPKSRLSIIDKYYKVKMVHEPINAMLPVIKPKTVKPVVINSQSEWIDKLNMITSNC